MVLLTRHFLFAPVPKDPSPQWRRVAWSHDCALLAYADSTGTVRLFDLIGSELFLIPPVTTTTLSPTPSPSLTPPFPFFHFFFMFFSCLWNRTNISSLDKWLFCGVPHRTTIHLAVAKWCFWTRLVSLIPESGKCTPWLKSSLSVSTSRCRFNDVLAWKGIGVIWHQHRAYETAVFPP